MNKIVREHYPVEKLPEDLRGNFPSGTAVTIEIIDESGFNEDAPAPLSTADAVALMRQMQKDAAEKGYGVTEQEAVRRIRELRDEWDD